MPRRELTPEAAYWHACSGTPVGDIYRDVPAVVRAGFDTATYRHMYMFADGVIATATDDEIVASAGVPNRLAFYRMIYSRAILDSKVAHEPQ